MRLAAVILILLSLVGCTTELPLGQRGTPIGDFNLTQLQVSVKDPIVGGLSRKADDAVFETALNQALHARFDRFDGTGIYTLKVDLVGYVLAAPGIPILLAPRSLLGMNVNVYVFENGAWRRLNAETYKLVTFEDAGGDTVLGSGYTQNAQEQLDELAANAAIEIEKWMRENADWFVAPDPAPKAGSDNETGDAAAT